MQNYLQIREKIAQAVSSVGIEEWGVCRYNDVLPLLECRAAKRIPNGAKSVIVCLFPYRMDSYPEELNISKYAVVKDYHTVTAELLSKAADMLKDRFGGEYAVFADNSPIREVFAAYSAGLGVIGKNGLLINPVYGSDVFIGEIITTLDIKPDTPLQKTCLECNMCIKRCPGGAIGENGVDVSLCLSDITQKKGELTEREEEIISENGMIWGCDVCSDVCPMNKNAKIKPHAEFLQDISFEVDLNLSTKQLKEKAFGFRGKKVLERNIELLKRADKI